MVFPLIAGMDDLCAAVTRFGFVPFFRSRIPGFSLEECIRPDLWFSGDDGPWEWKGPVIARTGCAYGKLLHGKMMYVSRDWYIHLCNVRRGGMPLEERWEMGLISRDEKRIADVLAGVPSLPSKMLRKAVCCAKSSAFDAAISRLQASGDVTITGFDYAVDRHGRPYGWGIARYALADRHFGADFAEAVYASPPEASREMIASHLTALLGEAARAEIYKLIG